MRRLSAKVGTYLKDGQTKGEYVSLGVLMQGNDGGEYILLDPTVSIAGVLAKQNAMAWKENKPLRDTVMVGVFDDSNQGQQPQQQNNQPQPGYQQPQPGYQQK